MILFLIIAFPAIASAFLPAAAIPAASSSGPAAPFVIGGIAAFTAIKSLWKNPLGELKVHLTKVYEDAQEGLEENLARYLEEPASLQAQRERLSYFDKIWELLRIESLKTEQGRISWEERQRDGKWCWECYFRDPIANDPRLTVNVDLSPSDTTDMPPSVGDPIPVEPIGPSETQTPQMLAIIIAAILTVFLVSRL